MENDIVRTIVTLAKGAVTPKENAAHGARTVSPRARDTNGGMEGMCVRAPGAN